MAPILPHIELRPTHALRTLETRKMQNITFLSPPCRKELASVEISGSKSCSGAELAKQVKGRSKGRHRCCGTIKGYSPDLMMMIDQMIQGREPGVRDAARQESPPMRSDAARVALRPTRHIPRYERR